MSDDKKKKGGCRKFFSVFLIIVAIIILFAGFSSCIKTQHKNKVLEKQLEDKKQEEPTENSNIINDINEATVEETVAPVTENIVEDNNDTNEVSLDFKKNMDEYEAFFDEYVEFMKKYKESGYSPSLLTDYSKMMAQYAKAMKSLDNINKDSLNAADLAYYTEVMARITSKLAAVS